MQLIVKNILLPIPAAPATFDNTLKDGLDKYFSLHAKLNKLTYRELKMLEKVLKEVDNRMCNFGTQQRMLLKEVDNRMDYIIGIRIVGTIVVALSALLICAIVSDLRK
jgi:hypothetical protein